MAIKVNITDPAPEPIEQPANETVNIKIVDPNRQMLEFKLNMRRALNGDLMIFDHADIDIVVMLESKKIVAFAKDLMSEVVYGAESRLFDHLKKKGVVAFDSIQGGNVYGSLEAKILESTELDSVKASLYEISQWMDGERPYFKSMEAYDEMMDDALLDPDEKDSTELGEVPQDVKKGSIDQSVLFSPYTYGRYLYE
jgi:hypothetical protein